MKKFFWLIIIFVIALLVANVSQLSSGNVVIYMVKYRISFSLNLLFALWLASFFLIWLLARLAKNITHLPSALINFFKQRKNEKIEKIYTQCFLDYFAGKYQRVAQVTQKLYKRLPKSDKTLLLLLVATDSLLQLNNPNYNNLLLEFNNHTDSDVVLPIRLLKAKIAIHSQDYLEAKNHLNEALLIDKKNVAAYRMLLDVYLALDELVNARNCFAWLNKRTIMPAYVQKQYQQRMGVAS